MHIYKDAAAEEASEENKQKEPANQSMGVRVGSKAEETGRRGKRNQHQRTSAPGLSLDPPESGRESGLHKARPCACPAHPQPDALDCKTPEFRSSFLAAEPSPKREPTIFFAGVLCSDPVPFLARCAWESY
ncbi:unnamed protein product [Notodromas monacha]|uniref:Uncharacterized protein n=1 Tax=Notodromas monacha TaxID=399045 RepID=A0A7R9BKW4_9CRUS|nr:unnamed protein product [Notodromas monacha]CAG0915875.1 unnamed protein product [Notodromas monacha]